MIQDGMVRENAVGRDPVSRMARMPLFQGFSDRELERIAWHARQRVLEPKEQVYEQGAEDGRVFLVMAGVVLLEAGGDGRIGTMVRPGSVFGEEGLFDDGPRGHGARAVMRSEVLSWDAEDMDRLERDHPRLAAKFVRRLARPLTQRWRSWVVEAALAEPAPVPRLALAPPVGSPEPEPWWDRLRSRLLAMMGLWQPRPRVASVAVTDAWEPVPIARWPLPYEG